jgi:uncharacterized Ntn-hydrolase superfamily protein
VITSTFTIVATDGEEWGVAVASRVLAVGAIVPAADASWGVVATQATVNVGWKRAGLSLLASGKSAQETAGQLVAEDPSPDVRQLIVLDRAGRAAAHSGHRCQPWAGHIVGEGFAVAGNLLAGEAVIESMASCYRSSAGPLAQRLLLSLQAGDSAGGDRRGRQSAAVQIVRQAGGIDGLDDRVCDLRVDDHPDPVRELQRIASIQFGAE